MIFLSSGIADINRKTLKTLSSLNNKKLELFGIGISEINTIIVSKIFHPLLKKLIFLAHL